MDKENLIFLSGRNGTLRFDIHKNNSLAILICHWPQ